jgi:hypothetical protein
MAFKLKIEGGENIELGKDNIITAVYKTDTPDDSNARSTDVSTQLTIVGRIITATDGDQADDTLKLATWSLMPATKADSYRKATLEVLVAGQVVRKVYFPNAFVVDYTEDFGADEGVGTFNIVIRQKKDKVDGTKIEGGYAAET